MSLRQIKAANLPSNLPTAIKAEIPQTVLARYDATLKAAADDGPGTIGLYGVIGESWDGTGWTAKRMGAVLRSIGTRDVTVNINSPGGDVFEGLAIYNLLRAHSGKVTVNVIGLAASAGSFIAMAGDQINIAKAGFLMIHNAWLIAAGDKQALREVADWLDPFDATLAEIYADRTGKDAAEIAAMMGKETWMSGTEAVDSGFADDYLEADRIARDDKTTENSLRKTEASLRARGFSRADAQAIISDIKSMALRDSAPSAPRDSAALKAALELISLKGY